MIALVLVATEVPQEDQLVRSLDSLGDHLEMQAVSERDNGANDGRVVAAGSQFADECAIDLQLVERQFARRASSQERRERKGYKT